MARTIPLLDPHRADDDGGHDGDDELASPAPRDAPQAGDVDQADTDEEDDGAEDGVGHIGEHGGEEQRDEQHDRRHRQVGQLGAALLLVEDLGLGRAAVDDEGSRQPGGEVGAGEPDDVAVHVDALAVLHREAA